jgi:hypothetical protein
MDILALDKEHGLGYVDPIREARWNHMITNEKGIRYPDIRDDYEKYTVESILDNTAIGALKSFGMPLANFSNIMKMMHESTSNTTPGVATFLKFAFPLVRRIWAKSIGKNLVSVQPMRTPTTMVFTLDQLRHNPNSGTSFHDRTYNPRDYAADPGELSTPVREVNLQVTSSSVTASAKKLKSKYSLEVAQDLSAYHNLSLDNELLNLMAREIALEIDAQIIYDLVTQASAGIANWSISPGSALPTEIESYNKTIRKAFNSASNFIFQKIYRQGNFIVSGVSEIQRLEDLGEQTFTPSSEPQGAGQFGRVFAGRLFGKFDVYKDPFFPVTNQFLVGFKGENWLESGYVYAPYQPYQLLPQFVNPDDFSVTKAAWSRQAFFMKNSDHYALVNLTGS